MNKREECIEIYREAFGDDGEFLKNLFESFFDCCYTLEIHGKIAAMLFLLPCELKIDQNSYPSLYLFAAATAQWARSKGYMTRLLEQCTEQCEEIVFLRPADSGLVQFYSQRGFCSVNAISAIGGEVRIVPTDEMLRLAQGGETDGAKYTLMYRGNVDLGEKTVNFTCSME